MDLRSRDVRDPVTRALGQHMAAHHGVIDRDTALRLGATDGLIRLLVRRGAWEPLHAGVYRAASAPPTPEQELFSAVLACGPGAVASHRSATWLWGLFAVPPDRPEVSVSRDRAPRVKGVQVYRSSDLLGVKPVERHGIPATAAARTVLDVSGIVPARVTDIVIDRAISTRVATVPSLTAALERFGGRGRRGAGTLRAALGARGIASPDHAPTPLESALARLIRIAGVAPPVAEYQVPGSSYRIDHAWPEILFGIEGDGWDGHAAYADFNRNIEKANWLGSHGWDIAHFSWEHIKHRPEYVITEIIRRIKARTLHLD